MKHIKKHFILLCLILACVSKASLARDEKLLQACRNGDLNEVAHLLKSVYKTKDGAWKYAYPSFWGESPIRIACENNNFELAEILLQNGAAKNINKADDILKETPIFLACRANNLKMAKLLLANGAQESVNKENKREENPLYWACRCNNREMVKLLLKSGARASVDVVKYRIFTPLYWACRANNLKMVKLLLAYGAQESINFVDDVEETPLHWACCRNNIEMARLLLANGAQKSINVQENSGLTPMYWACKNDNVKMIELLLRHGADIEDVRWEDGSDNSLEIIKLLVKYGGQKRLNYRYGGMTPLFLACACKDFDVVKLLLQHGAQKSINVQDTHDELPLDCACKSGDVKMFELLFIHGAYVYEDMLDMTNDQTIKNYIKLDWKFCSSENKITFIKDEIAKKNVQGAQLFIKFIFGNSVREAISKKGKRNIESSLFAKLYSCCDSKFLEDTFDVPVGCRNDIWGYAKEVLKKDIFYMSKKEINAYDFRHNLRHMQTLRSFVKLRPQGERVLKRKRYERLGPRKNQKILRQAQGSRTIIEIKTR